MFRRAWQCGWFIATAMARQENLIYTADEGQTASIAAASYTTALVNNAA